METVNFALTYTFLIISAILLHNCVEGNDFEADLITRRHKQYRNLFNSSAMMQLKWNSFLAEKAQSLVLSCPLSPDDLLTDESFLKYGINMGTQDIIDGQQMSLISIVDTWGLQRAYYVYPNICDGGNCNNWIQMVWEKTSDIGCGSKICKNNQILVCLYEEKVEFPSSVSESMKKVSDHCSSGYKQCGEGCCEDKNIMDIESSHLKETKNVNDSEIRTTGSSSITGAYMCLLISFLTAALLSN